MTASLSVLGLGMSSQKDIDGFLDKVRNHFVKAIMVYPDFKGLECIAAEFADVVKAMEEGNQKEVQRQCIHLAVVALRQYLASQEEESMKPT